MKCILVFLLSLPFYTNATETSNPSHGEVNKNNENSLVSWDSKTNQWISLDTFWKNYADNNSNRHWGTGRHYPDYAKVLEFDTFLVQVPSGVCLMEFFHTRWRRANDVRRWDDQFNDYSGCAKVFE